MNFVNIDQENITPTINLNKIAIELEPFKEIIITPVKVELPQEEEQKEGCIQAKCPVTVGCSDEYFAIKNLFSELTDDYLRAIIRLNLGISESDALLWGKIGGNLANQKDLYKFVQDVVKNDLSNILESLNLELKYWTQQIENKIESLASNITSILVIPRYATSNQLPVDVLLTWEYDLPVEALAVNGVAVDTSTRDYIFLNVTDSLSIRLSYLYNGVWLARNINFEVAFPTFYGTSQDYTLDLHTITDKVKVNAGEGEYIYVITKNESDLAVNGIIGGFILVGFTQIASTRYIIYKSLNPGLGETVIKIHDRE